MKFDLKTHVRNKKGYVTQTNPYRLIIENGVQLFERPPGSGIFYGANGKVAKAPKDYIPEAEMTDAKAAEMLAAENAVLRAKLAQLEEDTADEAEVPEVKEEAKPVVAAAPSKPSFIKK